MKVVFTKSVMERIEDVKLEALSANREIDRIELTDDESTKLNAELNAIMWSKSPRSLDRPFIGGDQVFGINILST